MSHTVYMDYNASAPLRPEARSAVLEVMDGCANPSSVHALGRAARQRVEDAREQVRALVNAPRPTRVTFTSGGTESNALALIGSERRRVFAPRSEHPSVLKARGGVEFIAVDGNGLIDPFDLEEMLAGGGDDVIVSVMLANNETGVLQQIEGIVAVARRYDALVHTDAVQAAGKIEIDFQALGVDYLSLSAHKLGGLQGVGALVSTASAPLRAVQPGGGQENGLRGGTENVSGIASFGAAACAAQAGLGDMVRIEALRDQIEARILDLAPDARIIAAMAERLPNTSMIVMPGVDSETQVMALDLAGLCVSAGSACASGKAKQGGVLAAMGVSPDVAKCALRISLGYATTQGDIELLISAWADLYRRKARRLGQHEMKSEKTEQG